MNLICIQESNLNLSFFRIYGFSSQRSDRTHFRSSILSLDDPHASGSVIIFIRQDLSFSKLSTSSLSLFDPYSDYVGVSISLNNSSSNSFFNVYVTPICSFSTDSGTDYFSPLYSFLSSRNLFIFDTPTATTSLKLKEVHLTTVERKYSIVSSPLTSFLSITLTYQLYSIALLAVAPFLISTLLPPLLLFLARGKCFKAWALAT